MAIDPKKIERWKRELEHHGAVLAGEECWMGIAAALLAEREEVRRSLHTLAERWRADAAKDAGDYYGDQFEMRPDLADEVEAALKP